VGVGADFFEDDMAHVQLEFDAIGKAHSVAALVGLPPPQVTGGLCELWAHCWKEKTDVAAGIVIEGIFASSHARLIDALLAFGFLEKVPYGYRVRGAEKYLRIQQSIENGRRRGGLAAKGNLRHALGSPLGSSSAPPSAQAEEDRRLASASFTDHRSPITDHLEAKDQLPVVSPPAAVRVFEHWRSVHRPTARVFDAKTRKAVEARLAEGFTEADLIQAIDGCKASPHHQGQNDRGKKYDSLELICRDGSKVHTMQGYIETAKPQRTLDQVRRGLQRAEDQGWEHEPHVKLEDLK
jgi:hypothetical protein